MGRVPILFFVGLGSEGAIRVKNVGAFAVAMMLAVLMPAWCAYAESRDAQVRYEVSATVIYVDGETETVQKVPVGSILKAPNPKGSTGGTFAGWWNEESGVYWDFSAPVEGSMTLAAQYAYLESDEEAAQPEAFASASPGCQSPHVAENGRCVNAACIAGAVVGRFCGRGGVWCAPSSSEEVTGRAL